MSELGGSKRRYYAEYSLNTAKGNMKKDMKQNELDFEVKSQKNVAKLIIMQ